MVRGMIFENMACIHLSTGLHAELQLAGTSVDDEAPPIHPISIGSHRARRVDHIPAWVAPGPGLVEAIQGSISLLQPTVESFNGFGAIAIQHFLRTGPDIALPGRFDVRLIPAVVGVKGRMRRTKLRQRADILNSRLPHRLPVQAKSWPPPSHIV